MTSVLEKFVAIIAPYYCIVCGTENNILCDACRKTEYISLLPTCVICAVPKGDWQLCRKCQLSSSLQSVWVGGAYDGVLAAVIKKFKFERAKAAYEPLGKAMLEALPYDNWLVVPVPTVTARVRQRGYDQASLLARYIAAKRHLLLSYGLVRIQNVRQVGTNRVQRQKQSAQMFSMDKKTNIKGAKILLVDDVCTTGATLSAAAHIVRKAGAAHVDAVVAAWQSPNK